MSSEKTSVDKVGKEKNGDKMKALDAVLLQIEKQYGRDHDCNGSTHSDRSSDAGNQFFLHRIASFCRRAELDSIEK